MSGKARVLLALTVIAFLVAFLRFMPGVPISRGVTHFAGGLGFGFLIAVLVIWAGERG